MSGANRFVGKVVIVTGAAQGIGRGVAMAIASEGGTVLAVDRLPPAERTRFGGAAVAGQVQRPMPVIPEPHGSWVEPLERAWQRRYGA